MNVALTLVVVIPNIPVKSTMLRANTRHGIRPFHLPVYDKSMEEKDLFHPAMEAQAPLALSDATAKRFQESKDAVMQYVAHNSIVETPGSGVIVTPLGTSSAIPTKYRNGKYGILKFCIGIYTYRAL